MATAFSHTVQVENSPTAISPMGLLVAQAPKLQIIGTYQCSLQQAYLLVLRGFLEHFFAYPPLALVGEDDTNDYEVSEKWAVWEQYGGFQYRSSSTPMICDLWNKETIKTNGGACLVRFSDKFWPSNGTMRHMNLLLDPAMVHPAGLPVEILYPNLENYRLDIYLDTERLMKMLNPDDTSVPLCSPEAVATGLLTQMYQILMSNYGDMQSATITLTSRTEDFHEKDLDITNHYDGQALQDHIKYVNEAGVHISPLTPHPLWIMESVGWDFELFHHGE